MKRVCGTCIFGIDCEAGQSGINVLCAFDNQWHPDRTEGCVKWKETTGGLSKKDRMDLAYKVTQKEDTERRHKELMQDYQENCKNQLNAETFDMNSKADLLIITAAKIESQAVMDVFRKATGKVARPIPIIDRVYHDLGEINGTRAFLALSEMGAGGLWARRNRQYKRVSIRSSHRR